MLAVDLLYIALIMFNYIPCIPALSKTFIMKECCILSNAFSASNEMIMCLLFFSLFIWWIMLTDFCILNHPCICGMKLSLSWWMMVLMCSWIRFASFIEYFCINIHECDWSVILLLSNVFLWFRY